MPTSKETVILKPFVSLIQNISRHHLYLEFLRSSIVGLLEAPEKSMEATIWTGFLFLKASQYHTDWVNMSSRPYLLGR